MDDGQYSQKSDSDESLTARGPRAPGQKPLKTTTLEKPVVKKRKIDIIKEELEKLNKDFFESQAMIDELMNIFKKGESQLKKKLNSIS